MNYVELSLENLKVASVELAQEIEKTYRPDLIVYIARGGYLIGLTIANYFHIPCIGIYAERKGNGLKNFLSPILRVLPKRIKLMLRQFELKSGAHASASKRNIFWDKRNNGASLKNINRILVVDDSVDTGHSMLQVKNKIYDDFDRVIIKTAAINVWSKSSAICITDYTRYKDTIITTPMSKDSQEYPLFDKLFEDRFINN